MNEQDLTYKITILEILERAGFALTKTQITDFFLDNDITDYFTVQDAGGSLLETDNIALEQTSNQIFYRITEKGQQTVALFPERITGDLKKQIVDYFSAHEITMRSENSLLAEYFPNGEGYVCRLKQMEGKSALIEVSLSVSSKSQAEAICANWKVKSEAVYDSLMDILVS